MRKLYYFFILFFSVFLVLEWFYKPSQKFFNQSIEPKLADTNVVSEQGLELVVDDYAAGKVDDISEIFSEDFEMKTLSHEDLIRINDESSQNHLTQNDLKNSTNSQVVSDTLTWKMLGVIKYIKKPHPDFEEGVMYPVINSNLKTKQGKRVIIKGFIVPVDTKTYALSKNVFANCFFCGQAGPETITGIKFRDTTPKLKTDQYVTLEGNFRYNDADVDDWIYHIDDAVIKTIR